MEVPIRACNRALIIVFRPTPSATLARRYRLDPQHHRLLSRPLLRYPASGATRRTFSTRTAPAMSPPGAAPRAQAVDGPLTQSAAFLVLSVLPGAEAAGTVRSALAGIEGLAKTVSFRDAGTSFSVTVGIGSEAWDRLTGGAARPAELHPFRPVAGQTHTAVSTAGDVLVHIRSDRRDLCFEFERQLMKRLDGAVRVDDQTVGFRYFDQRDLLGFVDGTANPVGPARPASTLVTAAEDEAAVSGSYVVVQKYLHDMAAWDRLPAEKQEAIVGRTKMDNVELDDAAADEQKSHKTLATVEDDQGVEHDILRDNMPFGAPGSGEFGTYFIGYSSRLWVMERMLDRMFIGDPPGKHDRILDYSKPVTGTVFFVPSAGFLANLDGGDD
ncbi:hypothetical protein XA68_12262 [Ophiocordyceps unilateralis]|uniref:Dyp-type peroxidase n=1 Tax=Ophiocordyceps unilateralis TaxID=268505 RepID=A0A2A9PF14_OPHUN|nr:hypothetical protein XA68_12262 [Ophiocordyceps unilateralis]